jgi:hypothetical protein
MSNLTETQCRELASHVSEALNDILCDPNGFWFEMEWFWKYFGVWNPYTPELTRLYYQSGS